MVIDGQVVMTETDIRAQRKEALFAHEEAKEARNRLILELKAAGKRAAKFAKMVEAIEYEAERPLHSEAGLLTMTPEDFAGVDHATIRALANSIAAARREVAETAEAKRIVGYRA
jgi:hypothetical protein